MLIATKQSTHPRVPGMILSISLVVIFLAACSAPDQTTPTGSPTVARQTTTPTLSHTATQTPTLPPAVISPVTAPYLAEAAWFGTGNAEAVAWSPDGETIAVATSLGIDLYDAETFERTGFLETRQWYIGLAYSPDGKLLAAHSKGGSIQVWDTDQKGLLFSLEGGGGPLIFNADGTKLVSGGDQTVHVWDMSTGQLLDSFAGYSGGIKDLAISPDGNFLLVASPGELRLRDMTTREMLYQPIDANNIEAVFFSPDGDRFVTVSYINLPTSFDMNDPHLDYQSTVRYWDTMTGELLDEYNAEKDIVYSVAVSPDQRWIATGGLESISIWDASSKKVDLPLEGYGWVKSLVFSPDGQKLASVEGSFGRGIGTVQIWDLTTHESLKTFDEYMGLLINATFSPDGRWAAVAGTNHKVQVWEVASGQLLYIFDGSQPLAFSPDGKIIAFATGSEKNIFEGYTNDYIELHDVETGEHLSKGLYSCAGAATAAFSPDSRTLAYAGEDCQVTIREVESGKVVHALGPAPDTESLAFSPDGRMLAVGGDEVEIWDVQTGNLSSAIEGANYDSLVAFSPDGRFLAISGFGGYRHEQVQIWDVAIGQPVFALTSQLEEVTNLAFGPDGQVLAIGGYAGYAKAVSNVELWDAWTGEPIFQVEVSTEWVVGLRFSTDGQTLMTAGNNGAIQLWNAHSAPAVVSTPRPTPTQIPTYAPTPTSVPIEITKFADLGKGIMSPVSRSPDGRLIAITLEDTLRWYDAATFEELGSIQIEGSWGLGEVYFSPNSKLVVVESGTGATIIDLAGRSILGGDWDGKRFASGSPFSLPAISADGKLVAAGHSDGRVYVWDLHSGETRFLLEGHAAGVSGVDFSPDGRFLASGSEDGTVRLWNPVTGGLVRVITGFLDNVSWVQFSSDGRRLMVGVRKQPDQVFDLNGGRLEPLDEPEPTPDPFAVYMHQQGYVESGWATLVRFSPDGRSLALSSGNVLVWDVASRELIAALENPAGSGIIGMAYSSDGARLATISRKGDILVWDIGTGEQVLELTSETLVAGQVFYAAGSAGLGAGIGVKAVSEQGLAF